GRFRGGSRAVPGRSCRSARCGGSGHGGEQVVEGQSGWGGTIGAMTTTETSAGGRASAAGDAPTHLLHGLWLPSSGLHLWLERVEGHRVLGAADDAAEAALPPVAVGLLRAVPRGRPEVELRTPKGKK